MDITGKDILTDFENTRRVDSKINSIIKRCIEQNKEFKKKSGLIKSIPQGKHTEEEIHHLIDGIKGGSITCEDDIVGTGKGGARPGAGRKPSATIKVYKKLTPEEKEENKQKRAATIKAIKDANTEKKKAEAEAKKKKEEEKEAKRKPYFKADDPPKGMREATMKEAADNHKIMLWGKKKADSKVIETMFSKPFDHSKILGEMAGLSGKFNRLKRELERAKTSTDKVSLTSQMEETKKLILSKMPNYHKALEISKEKARKTAESYEKTHGSE